MSGPTVFISYAHENDALRAAVKALADWLAQRGCTVLTDHSHIYRPPPEGWQAWMLACIARADVVLVVCTPMLKARYEKTASPDSGRGATYEGSIVTQHIYGAAMRNTKYFPILPEAGAVDDVPTFLKPWFNGHRFPSGYEGIRCMIFDAPPDAQAHHDESAGPTRLIDTCHELLTIDRLGAADAQPFFKALTQAFAKKFPSTALPGDAAAMVRWFSGCDGSQVQSLFHLVRRALRGLAPPTRQDTQRKAGEEAAVALYCLAAFRLVDSELARANAMHAGNGVMLYVPSGELLICAIIATTLFGGELHLKPAMQENLQPAMQENLPKPEHVYDVKVSAAGDKITNAFERAVFGSVLLKGKGLPEFLLDTDPLPSRLRERLNARIDDIKEQERALALVVRGLAQPEAAAALVNELAIPMLIPNTELTTQVLGMNADRLLAEVSELWEPLIRSISHSPAPGPVIF